MQKHNQHHSITNTINNQSARSHSNLQMNIGWITLCLMYIKYYIGIEVNILKWIMILMDIIIHIFIVIDECIIIFQYSNLEFLIPLERQRFLYCLNVLYIHSKRIFAAAIYERDQLPYRLSKIVAVYAVTTVGIAPDCFGWSQVEREVYCVRFVTYSNNNYAYKYTVLY